MTIHPGDIFWVQVSDIPHPHVVIQEHSGTVVVCALTSNLNRIHWPGNVLLEAGEANLPKPSVVEVSKESTLEIAQLGNYIGSLDARRIDQIMAGRRFLQVSYFER